MYKFVDPDGDLLELNVNYSFGHPSITLFADEGVRMTIEDTEYLIEQLKNCIHEAKASVIELNEHGMAIWRHKTNKVLFAERTYRWCDRIIVLDETNQRTVVDDTKFSTFNFNDWIPVRPEEFNRVKRQFKEIYNEEKSSILP